MTKSVINETNLAPYSSTSAPYQRLLGVSMHQLVQDVRIMCPLAPDSESDGAWLQEARLNM